MKLVITSLLLAFSTSVSAYEYLSVSPDTERLNLFGYTWLFTDSTNDMTSETMASLPESIWKRGKLTGYSDRHEWVLIPLINETDQDFDKVLYLSNPVSHKIDYHFVVNDSLSPHHVATGLARPSSAKLYNDPSYPTKIHFPANSKVHVLVRIVDPLSSINIPMFILDQDYAYEIKDRNLFFSSLWLGVIVFSIVLSLVMYAHTRQVMFFHYSMFAISVIMILTSGLGTVFLFVDSDPYQIVTNYYQVGAVIMINFMPRFINCIVPIFDISRWTWKFIKYMGLGTIGIAICYSIPFFKFSPFFTSVFISTMVTCSAVLFVYLLITLFIASLKKKKRAKTLFIVYVIYLGMAFSNIILPLFGYAERAMYGVIIVLMGSIFETLAFVIFMAQVTLAVYREKEELNEQVRNNQELMINAIVKGQEEERNRFAKDLHDGFGQMISSLMLNLRGLQVAKSSDTEERTNIFEMSTSILNDMYAELKNICFNLMPRTLISGGVGAALKELANRINQSGEVFIQVSIFDMDHRLEEVQETSIYRISQEWINNVLKYSDATNISLQVIRDEKEIILMIEDNGTGFEKDKLVKSEGNGWKNIQSRANLIHGEVTLETTHGIKGNTLILYAPVTLTKQKANQITITN